MIMDPYANYHHFSQEEVDRYWLGIEFGNSFLRVSSYDECPLSAVSGEKTVRIGQYTNTNIVCVMETNLTRYELFGDEEGDVVDFGLVNIKRIIDNLSNDTYHLNSIKILANDDCGIRTQIVTEAGVKLQSRKDIENLNRLATIKIVDNEKKQQVEVPVFTVLTKLFEKLRRKILSTTSEPKEQDLFKCNVITMPIFYSDLQSVFVKDAAEIAGFKVQRMIREPFAAAIGYRFDTLPNRDLLVLNCGSTKTTLVLYSVDDGIMELIDSATDSTISGTHIDELLVGHCAAEFKKKNKKEVHERARQRLRQACKKAKEDLYGDNSPLNVLIRVDSLVDGTDFSLVLSKPKFEQLIAPLHSNISTLITDILERNSRSIHTVNDIVLSGGSCHISKIGTIIKECFKANQNAILYDSISPKSIKARGAALYAEKFRVRNNVWFVSVLPLSIGLDQDGKMIILVKRNTVLPHNKTITVEKKVNRITNKFHFKLYMGESCTSMKNILMKELCVPNIHNVNSQPFELKLTITETEIIILSIMDTMSINEYNFQIEKTTTTPRIIEEMVRTGEMESSS